MGFMETLAGYSSLIWGLTIRNTNYKKENGFKKYSTHKLWINNV
jgi:hypothetical protein